MTTINKPKYEISVESRMCHPETCCCSSHGIYVVREGAYFVERFESMRDAEKFMKDLEEYET